MSVTTQLSESLRAEPLHALEPQRFEEMVTPRPDETHVITFLLGMETKGSPTRKNHITFKNAVQEATNRIEGDPDLEDRFAKTLDRLLPLAVEDAEFWRHQEAGLAMIIHDSALSKPTRSPFRSARRSTSAPTPNSRRW